MTKHTHDEHNEVTTLLKQIARRPLCNVSNLVADEKSPSVYTVEPGRTIAKDGVPYVYIGIQYDLDNNRSISPTEADELTHLIAKLLNEHFAKNP